MEGKNVLDSPIGRPDRFLEAGSVLFPSPSHSSTMCSSVGIHGDGTWLKPAEFFPYTAASKRAQKGEKLSKTEPWWKSAVLYKSIPAPLRTRRGLEQGIWLGLQRG